MTSQRNKTWLAVLFVLLALVAVSMPAVSFADDAPTSEPATSPVPVDDATTDTAGPPDDQGEGLGIMDPNG